MTIQKTNKLSITGTTVFEKNWQAFNDPNIRYIKNEGGSRSSKTYSICQMLIVYAIKNPDKIISVIRKTSTALRDSVYKQDFIPMLKQLGIYNGKNHNKSEKTYTFDNGTVIEFYGADDEQKLRGRKRDIAWLNEANELYWDDFKQIAMRTSGKIIIDFNPSDVEHFLYELKESETTSIHSTYLDNPYLSKEQIQFILDLKETDPNGYEVFALGKRTTSIENVFRGWNWLKEKPEYFKDDDYIYGLDFGFSHPLALIKIYYNLDKNELYLKEEVYSPGLTETDMLNEFDRLKINKSKPILCDYSRPELIRALQGKGYNAINANKDVKSGINAVRFFKIGYSKESTNIKKEFNMYKYKKNGNIISDEVIKKYDDAMDAIRYAALYIKTHYVRTSAEPSKVYVFDF